MYRPSGPSASSPTSARSAPARLVPARLASALRTLALTLALAATSATSASAAAPAPPPSPISTQQHYLALAQAGVASAESHWRDTRLGWYDELLNDRAHYPLASIWDSVPLFESIDAIAIAQPTPANRAAVTTFARGAERYLNRGLRPLAGYSPYPGDRTADTETWFDDNGWWGIAFVNAYRATGATRWLADAKRALAYVAAAGWDAQSGGIWWNTTHPFKSGPALAADTLLAVLLYQQSKSSFALAQARKFLTWANVGGGFSPANGLYADSSVNPTPIDYIEGPLIYAQAVLCKLTAAAEACHRAIEQRETSLRRFGYLLDFAPQYDAIYLQWMLALYSLEGDRTLYEMALDNARNAEAHARNVAGLYLLSWNGEALPPQDAQPGMLQTQAATTSLFAWLAATPPPSG
jgi:Glycosyl hydrolase family 76